jgi:purine-nucleoside phosphorylase
LQQIKGKPVAEAVKTLQKISPEIPEAAFVLGSGVNVLENLPESKSISFEEVFGIAPGVVGHAGSLTLGRTNGKLVAVMRGRFHRYEGHTWDTVTLPAKTMIEWGVPKLYLTNAAGGMNSNFKVGDLMLIKGYRDHLSPDFKQTGLIPALAKEATNCQNKLTEYIAKRAKELAGKDKNFRPIQEGVFVGLLGPNYESLAEIEMLKRLKIDAVAMSTIPELQTAMSHNILAAAISVITNVWTPDIAIGGHEEVLQAAKDASQRLDKLFRACIEP